MDLLNLVLSATQGDAIDKLANQHQLSSDQTTAVISKLLPELTGRIENNVKQENGLDSLLSALSKGNHQEYVAQPERLTNSDTLVEGNKILGHLLGSKDTSRQVASDVETSTGVSAGIIKKLLPVVATMLMGAMSKGTQSSGLLDQLGSSLSGGGNDLLGSLLGSITQGSSRNTGANKSQDLVGSLLNKFLK